MPMVPGNTPGKNSVHQRTSTLSLDDILCAALDDLTGALERFPDNARLLTSAAVLHGRQGRVEHARELFRQGQAIDPRNAVLLRVRLQMYFHTGKEVKNGYHWGVSSAELAPH